MRIFSKVKKNTSAAEVNEEQDFVQESIINEQSIAGNPSLRKEYVESCCSRMVEAEERLKDIKKEYHLVNSYISDVQVIENLPEQQKTNLENLAKRIIVFNNDREECSKSIGQLTYGRYSFISSNEDKIEDMLSQLEQDESYCQAVRTDMRYLEGEKLGLRIEYRELVKRMDNMAHLGKISFTAFAALLFAIWLYYYNTGNDVTYMLYAVIAAGIVFVAIIFGIYQHTVKEMRYTEIRMNKAITMLNKIKLKYVNVASRLEYIYEKNDIKSSGQLKKMWNIYQGAEKKKQIYARTSEKLIEAQDGLIASLKSLGINDAEIWIAQPEAIVDGGEMFKLKGKLEKRREKIKAALEYNMTALEKSKAAITEFVNDNRKYAKEIMDIVNSYGE